MKAIRIVALVLAMALLLTGCSGWSLDQLWGNITAGLVTPFADMTYTRPDMTAMKAALNECCAQAQSQTKVEKLLDQVWEFYGQYNRFYTQYHLATIHYFHDMTDIYWEQEYSYCMAQTATAEAALEELFYALAASPLKEELEKDPSFGEGFFDSYVGQTIWDETFSQLMYREAELEDRYYELVTQAQDTPYYSDAYFETYGAQMAQLFVELIQVRQEIANYAGYDDYPSFAYDFYYYRDYTPAQAEQYFSDVQRELVPLYRQLGTADENWGAFCDQSKTFAYVKSAAEAMGGTVRNAFYLMETAGLYDISYGPNKYNGSFSLFLPDYYVPFVFVNPSSTQLDKLTFAHEFGHFCNHYASHGSGAGVDVSEIFSQGLEYLSLCYTEDNGNLEKIRMATCLTTYVEQAAYASFERQVYGLTGDQLTVENIQALYESIGRAYGFDSWAWDSRDYVCTSHFFTSPMYVVSYVVSNDAALQLYQMEKMEQGTGLACYTENLTTMQPYFLAFLEEAGLRSPFAPGRLEEVRKTLETVLG